MLNDLGIRAANPKDTHYLIDIDAKCFEHWAWPLEYWEQNDYSINVATIAGEPIGFSALTTGPFTLPGANITCAVNVVWMLKLGIKPAFRRQGIGTVLANCVKRHCESIGFKNVLSLVPETICHPGSTDVTGWLKKQGLVPKGVVPESFTEYGESIDGYLFDYTCPAPTVLKELPLGLGESI